HRRGIARPGEPGTEQREARSERAELEAREGREIVHQLRARELEEGVAPRARQEPRIEPEIARAVLGGELERGPEVTRHVDPARRRGLLVEEVLEQSRLLADGSAAIGAVTADERHTAIAQAEEVERVQIGCREPGRAAEVLRHERGRAELRVL